MLLTACAHGSAEKPQIWSPPEVITIEREISPGFFQDQGAPELELSDNPTDPEIAQHIVDLGAAVLLYRCLLNDAGVALVGATRLPVCQAADPEIASQPPA